MKNKLVFANLTLALCLMVGGSAVQAQTTTANTTASVTGNSTNDLREFVDWLSSLFSANPGGGNCPLRICGGDPDPK